MSLWLLLRLFFAPVTTVTPDGFDHQIHEGRVIASAAEPPACETCHTIDKTGRPLAGPGHAACFRSGCHEKKPGEPCRACHAQVSPPPRARPFFPPFTLAPDYGVTFPHDKHVKGCEDCHRVPGIAGPRPAAHARCVGCHAKPAAGVAPMSSCKACHARIAGRMVGPRQAAGAFRVGKLFSHAKHAGRMRSPDTAARCRVCHEAVTRVGGDDIPAPSMEVCETCHDGQHAFAARGPTCRRCHADADRATVAPQVPLAHFQHRAHAARGLALDCARCHALDANGAPRPASADHRPCADGGCHDAEFRALAPRICSGCHIGTEPFRALKADVPRNPTTEFGVEYSHAAHASRVERGCAACHTGIPAGPELRLGKGHASCSGSGCHGVKGGPAPTFDACAACHETGLLPDRDEDQRERAWSVSTRFGHSRHQADKAGAPLACESCHAAVAGATTVAAVGAPPKAACAPCHDGRAAFKMTGHGCARCHGK